MSPNSESEGELLIGEDSVFFVADEAVTDANYTQVGPLAEISAVVIIRSY